MTDSPYDNSPKQSTPGYVVIKNGSEIELIEDPTTLIRRDDYNPTRYKIHKLGPEVKIKVTIEQTPTPRSTMEMR
jgi:hypothetical protein